MLSGYVFNSSDLSKLPSQVVVVSCREPALVKRFGENQPEQRRSIILEALKKAGSDVMAVEARDGALEECVAHGVMTADKYEFLTHAYELWEANPMSEFASPDIADEKGLVPYFFVHDPPAKKTDPFQRRLSWHARDAFTPILIGTLAVLTDDASVCISAVELVCGGTDCYALTTNPGHHASRDHFGGYCFINWAAFITSLIRARGRRPFTIDVDYHAGDGTATFLDESSFVSLHARDDYPFLAPGEHPWAMELSSGTTWGKYEELLRVALGRRPNDCDVLVVSLGYDTLATDPDASDDQKFALQPGDFGRMRNVLRETKLPQIIIQEGGYALEDIPAAALAFWATY